MMDILVDKVVESLEYELKKTNSDGPNQYYNDKFIEFVTTKSITPETPHLTISVVEQDSNPTEFEISSMIGHTKENYSLQLQLVIKAASEADAKDYRRIITQRIKHAMLRKNGKFRELVLAAHDSDTGYDERVMDYKLIATRYDNTSAIGIFMYIAILEINIRTQVSYNES